MLQGTRIYLCGPVENADDPNNWRNKITPMLQEMGIEVLNPMDKPIWMPKIDGQGQRAWKTDLINEKDVCKIANVNNIIRKYCLSLVKMSDVLIVKFDKTFTVGTYEEIAKAADKPIFFICDDEIPSMWLMDQVNCYTKEQREIYFHKSIESCISMLYNINLIQVVDQLEAKKLSDKLDPYKWIFISRKP